MINQTILGFIKKELRQVLRDNRMRNVLISMPIIQMLLFGYALSTDVRNIRLSVINSPTDFIAGHVSERAVASRWFIKAETTRADPYEQIKANEADVVLIPPAGGLTKAIGRGGAQVQLLINASNVTRAQAAEGYLKAVIAEVLKRDLKIAAPAPQIGVDMRVLYNPSMRTAVFQIPAVMGMLILMTSLFFTSMAIAREKEQGTFEMLLSSPATPTEILLGKAIPFVIIGMMNLPLILLTGVLGFDVPMQGSLFLLILCVFIFVCASVAMGILISTISRDQQQAMLAGFLVMFPMQMLSGLLFPVENIPKFMQVMTYLNPLTYFLEILRNIMLKGGDLELVGHHVLILGVMAIGLMFFSYSRFRTTL